MLSKYLTDSDDTEEANLAWLLENIPQQMKGSALEAGKLKLPDLDLSLDTGIELEAPGIELDKPGLDLSPPDFNIRPPQGNLPALPDFGIQPPEMGLPNIPDINLPAMPDIGIENPFDFGDVGLPSLPMPDIGLDTLLPAPPLGDYADVGIPGVGLENGQITYNPSLGDITGTVGQIGGGMAASPIAPIANIGETIGNIAGAVSPAVDFITDPFLGTMVSFVNAISADEARGHAIKKFFKNKYGIDSDVYDKIMIDLYKDKTKSVRHPGGLRPGQITSNEPFSMPAQITLQDLDNAIKATLPAKLPTKVDSGYVEPIEVPAATPSGVIATAPTAGPIDEVAGNVRGRPVPIGAHTEGARKDPYGNWYMPSANTIKAF